MKKSVLLLGGAVVVAVALATVLSTRDQAQPSAKPAVPAGPTRINKEFDIAAGAVQSVTFEAPKVSGTLSGKWRSSGKGGNDTLSGFTLTDPSDAVLDSSFKRSASGSFKVKVSSAGRHTFVFENTGTKQAPRRVMLDAEFTPD
jgi:hypothetical protein